MRESEVSHAYPASGNVLEPASAPASDESAAYTVSIIETAPSPGTSSGNGYTEGLADWESGPLEGPGYPREYRVEPSPAIDQGTLRPVPGLHFAEIAVDAIRPNPRQPRAVFDADEMSELVSSVREVGILQPIVVRPLGADASLGGDGYAAAYELVMGERRWRAAIAADLLFVPAIVKETHDDAMLRDALLENLHRSQLNPLEEAAAYQQLLDEFGCSKEELSARLCRSRPQISNTLRLLKLPQPVQRRVAAGVLSAGHARALLPLEDGFAMERLAHRVVAEGLSVRTVEEIVSVGQADRGARPTQPRSQVRQLDDVAARLSDRFETRVQVTMGQRKGRVVIEFAGIDDLERILGILG
jgi:ParB family chromosome partitioning protein